MPKQCKELLDSPNLSSQHVAKAIESAPDRYLYDVTEAAGYLRRIGAESVTPWTVRRLVASEQLKCIKLGRKIFITRAALDELIVRLERQRR